MNCYYFKTQQNETETLNALEHLMNEFFNPHTGNIRKREIESQLESFSNQRDSWKLCLYFMTHSENHYVCMYSMTSIEVRTRLIYRRAYV